MQWHNTSQIQINDDIALPTFRLTEFLVRPECSREHTTGMVESIVPKSRDSGDRWTRSHCLVRADRLLRSVDPSDHGYTSYKVTLAAWKDS